MKFSKFIPPYQFSLIVTVMILYLTLLPKPFGEEELPLFPGADKLAHCCMFGGLALTFIFERKIMGKMLDMRQALIACIAITLFGLAIELIQNAMGLGRSGDFADGIADAIGTFCALPLCRWLKLISVR